MGGILGDSSLLLLRRLLAVTFLAGELKYHGSMHKATGWARRQGRRGFLGELAWLERRERDLRRNLGLIQQSFDRVTAPRGSLKLSELMKKPPVSPILPLRPRDTLSVLAHHDVQ